MLDQIRSRSRTKRARLLIWLAIVCGLASTVVLASDSWDDAPALAAALFLLWAVLSTGALRGYSWARWGLVSVLCGGGALALFWTYGLLVAFRDTSSNAQAESDYSLPLGLAAGVAILISAATLEFSESVKDYFAVRTVAPAERWDNLQLEEPAHWRCRGTRPSDFKAATRRRAGHATRARIGVTVLLALTAGLVILGAVAFSEWVRGATSEMSTWLNSLAFMIVIVVMLVLMTEAVLAAMAAYLLFFVAPFLLTLPLTLLPAWKWQDPARLLLLRPFGTAPRVTPALRRYLRREASLFGHCYTLADSTVRVPLYVRVPFLLGQLALFNFRTQKIRRPLDLQKLTREMNRRVMRNLNWILSRNRLFAITCADDAWQACVRALVGRVDVVLVEISILTPNIVWEFDLLRSTGALSRTILLTQGSDQARSFKELCPDAVLIPVVTYGSDTVIGAGVLAKALMGILHPESSGAAESSSSGAG